MKHPRTDIERTVSDEPMYVRQGAQCINNARQGGVAPTQCRHITDICMVGYLFVVCGVDHVGVVSAFHILLLLQPP